MYRKKSGRSFYNTLKKVQYGDDPVQYHQGGVPILAERKFKWFGMYNRIYYLAGQNHNLFVGGTGRGKTQTLALLMLDSFIKAGESFVAHDPKAELISYHERNAIDSGYQLLRIDFTRPQYSQSWNPLWLAWTSYKRSFIESFDGAYSSFLEMKGSILVEKARAYQKVDDLEIALESLLEVPRSQRDTEYLSSLLGKIKKAQSRVSFYETQFQRKSFSSRDVKVDTSEAVELVFDVSNALMAEQKKGITNPFWANSAGGMITGWALYLMERAVQMVIIKEDEDGNIFSTFPEENKINFKSLPFIFDDLGDISDLKKASRYLGIPVDADSIRNMSAFIVAEDATKSGIKTTFSSAIQLLAATSQIMEMTSYNSFHFQSIFEKKTAVFLLTHDEKSTYYPLVTLFFKQLYEAGIKETKHNPFKKLDRVLHLVLEEMGVLPPTPDIENLYAASRSRVIRIHVFIQSLHNC